MSKLTFAGNNKSFENCDSFSFKPNEVKMDEPISSGYAVIQLSKLHMYETFSDKLQPYFGEKNFSITIYRYRCIRIECKYKRYF